MRDGLHRRARVWTLGGLLLGGSIGLPIPGLGAPGDSPCGPLDVALVLDVTASMEPAIANVRTESARVLGAIERASGGNYRVALVTFRDDVTVDASFAPRNRATIEQALRRLVADGGEDEPEASDAALETVIDSLSAGARPQQRDFGEGFREEARKLVLLVTDARPGSFDDAFVAGVHDVRAHQRALEAQAKGIAISAVYPATDESQPYQETIRRIMSDYAQTTGGGYLETVADGRETDKTLRRILAACGVGGAIMPDWDDLGVLLPWTLPFLVLLLVGLRNELIRLIGVVFDIPIRLLVELVHALSRAVSGLLIRYREAAEGQRIVAHDVPGPRSPWIGWWLIWPLIYLLFVALVAIPDVVVSSERLAAMFGFTSTGQGAPVDLQWLVGSTWIALGLLYGFILGDLLGITPVHLPTQYLSAPTRRVLMALAAGGVVLTLVGTVLLFAWGQLQTVWDWQQVPPQEPVNSAISVTVAALMGLLLIGATALGGWAVFIGQGSLVVLGMGALLIALILVRLACKLLVVLLARLALVPCAVVDLPAAGIGKRIWDWWCEFSLAARLHCRPASFNSWPELGRDVADWWVLPLRTTAEPSAEQVAAQPIEDHHADPVQPAEASAELESANGHRPSAAVPERSRKSRGSQP